MREINFVKLKFSVLLMTSSCVLCLETAWGEQHVRNTDTSDDNSDTLVLIPNTDTTFNLADLPTHDDWGLVEIHSKTDLTAAENTIRR